MKEKILDCKHEIDLAAAVHDSKYGRKGYCKHCGVLLVMWRNAETKHNKVRMSKKERRRLQAEYKLKGTLK